MKANKKLLNRTTVVFILAVILLIFFSNTIYTFSLPAVTIGFPGENEFISYSVSGRGAIEFVMKESYFANNAGIVQTHAEVGDFLREGQLIFRIIPQHEDMASELARLQNEYASAEYRIEKADRDIAYYQKKINEAKADDDYPEPLDLSSYDTQLETLQFRLETLRSEFEALNEFYELGLETKSRVTDMENEIKALELQYDQTVRQRENAIADYERLLGKSTETARKQLDELLDSYGKAISDLEFQLKTLGIEKENLSIKIADLDFSDSETLEYRARTDSVLEAIIAENGSYVNKYGKVASVGVTNTAYKIMMKMEEDVSFIFPEMYVNVDIRSKGLTGIPGQVYSLSRDTGDLIVEVRIPPAPDPGTPPTTNRLRDQLRGNVLYGGETAEITLENNLGLMEYVVPNSALFRDSIGYYVYPVVRKRSAFGYDYITEKKYVRVVAQNEHSAALNPIGFTFENPIVINSDRVINDGDRVRPEDGANYVETR